MTSAFEIDLGTYQGRIAADNAPDGSYVYELGHALNAEREMVLGDYHEISQETVLDPEAAVIRVTLNITAPSTLPVGLGWEITGRLNGAVRASRKIVAGRLPRTITDLAISTAGAAGAPSTDTLAFRLEVVPA